MIDDISKDQTMAFFLPLMASPFTFVTNSSIILYRCLSVSTNQYNPYLCFTIESNFHTQIIQCNLISLKGTGMLVNSSNYFGTVIFVPGIN